MPTVAVRKSVRICASRRIPVPADRRRAHGRPARRCSRDPGGPHCCTDRGPLGHLQEIEAHSFWEIVDGAGQGMTPGKYVPFAPNSGGMLEAADQFVKESVENVGPDDAEKKTILGLE